MKDTTRDTAGVIAPPPLIYALTLGLGLFLHQRVPLPLVPRKIKICWAVYSLEAQLYPGSLLYVE